MRQPLQSYRDKMAQTSREALIAVGALFVTIIVWIVFGFGFSGLDIEVFHTPLWVVMGCVGTWVFAIIVCCVLGFKVYANFDLDSDEGDDVSASSSYPSTADAKGDDLR